MIAKLRVGWMLAGWSPGVLTMWSSSWFQATTMAPDRPSARGGAGEALLVATALIAVVVTTPSTTPSAATRAMGDFFICFLLVMPPEGRARPAPPPAVASDGGWCGREARRRASRAIRWRAAAR